MEKMQKFPRISLESQLLYERLIQARTGEVIHYEELAEIIGRDVQSEAYGCLYTARKKARNMNRKAFGIIANIGLKCLEDDEIIGAGFQMVRRLRNRARSGLKTLICLGDYAGLSDSLKIKHNAVAAILMMTNHVTAPRKVAALEGAIQKTMEKLTFQQTLQFFEKK
jgi:hypothetical protein